MPNHTLLYRISKIKMCTLMEKKNAVFRVHTTIKEGCLCLFEYPLFYADRKQRISIVAPFFFTESFTLKT